MGDFLKRAEASVTPAMERLESWKASSLETVEPFKSIGIEFANPWVMNWDYFIYMNLFYFCTLAILYYVMRGRKGFDLKPLMLVYNLTCVILAGTSAGCGYYYIFKRIQLGEMKYMCNTVDRTSDHGRVMAFGSAIFAAQKYWEFLDTFIFMLRKRYRQVTLLHVYHHSSITFIASMYTMYDLAGDCYLGVVLNSTVHVLMYSHYFVAALGMSTPWKPFLTQMQLLQFIAIMMQSIIAWTVGPDCGYPDFLKLIMIFYMVTMLVLFGRFYINSYLTPKKAPVADKKKKN
jgi:elongation of very long chain fatty acids protein 4